MNSNHQPRPAATPTAALPGTAAKVAVLEQRAAAGEQLWHPLDATERIAGMRLSALRTGARNQEKSAILRRRHNGRLEVA